jgi:drug/metabolite transporter (DMT)-like permease
MSPKEASPTRILLALGLVYVIWGSTYLAIRFAIETLPPFLMAGTRFLVAGAILFAWFRLRGTPAPDRKHWKAAVISGGLMLLGGNGLLSWAEQYVPSGLAALFVSTAPLWLVLMAWWGPDRERSHVGEIAGLLLGLLGVGLLLAPSTEILESMATEPRLFILGAVAVLVASLSWAAGSIYNRGAAFPTPQLYATSLTMVGGGVLLLLTGFARGELGQLSLNDVSLKSAAALAYLIVFGSLVAFSAYIWLLRAVRPAVVGTYAYVNPVVAVILGWSLAAEPLTPRTFVAMAIITGSVILVQRAQRRSARTSPTRTKPTRTRATDTRTGNADSLDAGSPSSESGHSPG